MRGPQEGRVISAAQAREPRAPGDKAQDLAIPLGNQGREDTGQRGRSCHRAHLSCAGQCRQHVALPGSRGLGAAGLNVGADFWVGELTTASVVVPPYVTLSLGRSGAAREHGPHRINSSQGAVPLPGGGAAPLVLTPDYQQSRTLPHKTSWKERERANS